MPGIGSRNWSFPGRVWMGIRTCSPPLWSWETMWVLSGIPSGWSGLTAEWSRRGNTSSPSMTPPRMCLPGLGRGPPTRSFPTVSAARPFPIPRGWWGGAGSTRTGERTRSIALMSTGRSGTGIFLAEVFRALRKSWAIFKAWGWRPSISARSLKGRKTTAMGRRIMRRSTPCWEQKRILPVYVERPTPWGCT